jgi:hypothetical protein
MVYPQIKLIFFHNYIRKYHVDEYEYQYNVFNE